MLSLLPGGRILVAVEPVDGRKGIDSLAGVVRSVLLGDPLSGDLYVFKNKGGDKLKILAWMGDGFALYLRRVEQGTFAFPTATTPELSITPTQLASKQPVPTPTGGVRVQVAWIGRFRSSSASASAPRTGCPMPITYRTRAYV